MLVGGSLLVDPSYVKDQYALYAIITPIIVTTLDCQEISKSIREEVKSEAARQKKANKYLRLLSSNSSKLSNSRYCCNYRYFRKRDYNIPVHRVVE